MLTFSFVQLIISIAAGSNLVYTPIKKGYYRTLASPSTKKEELLHFARGKSKLAHFNIFDIENRDIMFADVQIGIDTEGSSAPSGSAEEVLFFLENPSSCSPLSGIELRGTIEAIPEDQSTIQISIGKRKEQQTKTLRISEEATPGTTVAGIRWNVVAFQTASGIRCLGEDVGKDDGKGKKPPNKKTGGAPDASSMVQQVGENQYVIKRAELQKMTSNLNALARQARIVPAKEGGFKIYSIKKNSIYRSIGIKNGDIIKSINGIELSSPDKALEAYSRLQTASKLSLDVKRRGETMSIDYTVE